MSNARNLANLLDPSGDVSTDALDNVPPNTALVDSADNNVIDTSSGEVVSKAEERFLVKTYGGAIQPTDYNTLKPNSISYTIGNGTVPNHPANNNAIVQYWSTEDNIATGIATADERAVQLYYGDTYSYAASGFMYRVKQGTYGWHDWARVMTSKSEGAVIQTKFAGTDAITYTSSQSGFEAMRVSITPNHTTSKLLVMGTIYGAALDDSHAWLEYNIGGAGWTRDSNLNGGYNGGAAFADFSITRGINEPDQQVGFSTHVLFAPNTTSTVEIRVICSAENTNGFSMNIGTSRDTASSYNNTTTKSTLVVQEIAGGE